MWPRAALVLAAVLAEQRYDNPERKPCLAEVSHDGVAHPISVDPDADDSMTRDAIAEWAATLPGADVDRIAEDGVAATRSCRTYSHPANWDLMVDARSFAASRCPYEIPVGKEGNPPWKIQFGVEASDERRDALADAFAAVLPHALFVSQCGETALEAGQRCLAGLLRDDLLQRQKSCDGNRWHFVHVAKSAGTTMAHALAHSNAPEVFPPRLQVMSITMYSLPKFVRVVFVARDPLQRLTSAARYWRDGDGYRASRITTNTGLCYDNLQAHASVDEAFAKAPFALSTTCLNFTHEDTVETNPFLPIQRWINHSKFLAQPKRIVGLCYDRLQSDWEAFAIKNLRAASVAPLKNLNPSPRHPSPEDLAGASKLVAFHLSNFPSSEYAVAYPGDRAIFERVCDSLELL